MRAGRQERAPRVFSTGRVRGGAARGDDGKRGSGADPAAVRNRTTSASTGRAVRRAGRASRGRQRIVGCATHGPGMLIDRTYRPALSPDWRRTLRRAPAPGATPDARPAFLQPEAAGAPAPLRPLDLGQRSEALTERPAPAR